MNQQTVRDMDIAVIGMAGRFPHAADIDEYWRNISEGKDCINRTGVKRQNFVDAYGQLEDMYMFDPEFFNVNKADALCMDPQSRIIMECVYHGLEDAGYVQDTGDRNIGLFLGADENYYVWNNYYARKQRGQNFDRVSMFLQNTLASSISYKMNLQGPSIVMRAACATSLATVHYAVQSLLSYECNMAVAGGVNIREYDEGYQIVDGVSSARGQLRAYDENGDGYVPGNGMGVIVLKRAEDALNDGDHIYALIKGSALVNDGSRKVGYHASSLQGEAEAMIKAIELSGVNAEDIRYIEGHGTATPLGDRVEIQAIDRAYGSFSGNYNVEIGSVKANIGHLNVAAGIAGLIKTILCVYNGMIPPSVNYEKENPELLKYCGKIKVSTSLHPWEEGCVRRAGISSFGFGGSDAHMIVEQAPDTDKREMQEADYWLVPVSGNSEASLKRNKELLTNFITGKKYTPAEIAYTYQTGKRHFKYRAYLILNAEGDIVSSGEDEKFETLRNKGESFVNGNEIDWLSDYTDIPLRIPAPGYSFDKSEYKETENIISCNVSDTDKSGVLYDHSTQGESSESAEKGIRNRGFVIVDVTEAEQYFRNRTEEMAALEKIHLIGADASAMNDADRLCRLAASVFLKECRFPVGESLSVKQWMKENGFADENEHFIRFMLGLIDDNSIMNFDGENISGIDYEKLENLSSHFEHEHAAAIAAHPEFADILSLISECVHNYRAFARGEKNGNEILRKDGSIEYLLGIGQQATTETVYCKVLGELLKKEIRNDAEVSFMEIGGGTGQLTREIMKHLAGENIRYLFTDIGKSFVSHQRMTARKNHWNCMDFKVADAMKDLTVQGIGRESMDVIVEDNMMHLMKDIPSSLKNIGDVLKPGGYFIMVQSYVSYDIQECIFGILPDWWNYKESVPARKNPYPSLKEWKEYFDGSGLELVISVPESEHPETTNTALFVLRKPDITEEKTIEEELLAMAADILNTDDIAAEENITDYDFDSLSMLLLNAGIKEKYFVDIEIGKLYELGSLRSIAEYLEKNHDHEKDISANRVKSDNIKIEQLDPDDLLSELFEQE